MIAAKPDSTESGFCFFPVHRPPCRPAPPAHGPRPPTTARRVRADYAQFFARDVPAWLGGDVRAVAAGRSSDVAEACARGIDALEVGPRYGDPVDALTAQVRRDCARMLVPMRACRRCSG